MEDTSEQDFHRVQKGEIAIVVYMHGVRHHVMIAEENSMTEVTRWMTGNGILNARPKGSSGVVMFGEAVGPLAAVYWLKDTDEWLV